jgi:hypothetical protein
VETTMSTLCSMLGHRTLICCAGDAATVARRVATASGAAAVLCIQKRGVLVGMAAC